MGSGSSRRSSKKSNSPGLEESSPISNNDHRRSHSVTGEKGKRFSKVDKHSRKSSVSSYDSNTSTVEARSRRLKKLSIFGENRRNELIDVVLEYVNTNTIKIVDFDYASRLKATDVNLQWAIVNGTAQYCSALHPNFALTPRKSRRGWKTVRVYIASTFDDFSQERDILASKVFPELRKWCEDRNIRLSEVDLRWGSEEDLGSSECLCIAMSEIDRCYQENVLPFFVSMIGERIGWVPHKEDIQSNLATLYGWINNFSLFEMENVHAAHRRQNPNALCMLRDPEFIASLPDSEKERYVAQCDPEAARSERLKKELKDRLPNTQVLTYNVEVVTSEDGVTTLDGLSGSGTAFASMVSEFLKERIEYLYPFDPDIQYRNALQETKEAHRNFMAFYSDKTILREEIVDKIEQYIRQPKDYSPLIVTGDYGCGKSTILAQSAKKTIALCKAGGITCPVGFAEWNIMLHFVNCAPGSTDLILLLERLLKECGKTKLPPDNDVDMLIQQAKITLEECPKPVIIFIDAINLIDSDQQAFLWRWLPSRLSTHVRMIVSTVEGTESYQQLRTFQPPLVMISLSDLEGDINKQIVLMRLRKVSISLEEEHISDILKQKGAETPLWITLACQFIISHYNTLTISEILEKLPADLPGLQTLLVNKLESGRESKLVLAALYLILVSRRGLLEEELRLLLAAYDGDTTTSKETNLLPSRRWAVVYNRIHPYLRTHTEFGDGRMDFLNYSFMIAFEQRYLSGTASEVIEKKQVWHRLLANHFKTVGDIARKAEELPYHLEQLEDETGLADCLADWDIFNKLYSTDFTNDLIYYWQKAGGYNNAGKMYSDSLQVLSKSGMSYVDLSNQMEKVVTFLIQVGQYTLGMNLLKQLAVLEETKLGKRPDQMADIYQLLAKCKSEIIETMDEKDNGRLPMEKEVVDYCRRSLEVRKELGGEEQKINRGITSIIMTQHLASIADQEIIGADTVRNEAEEIIDEAIRVFDELDDLGHKADAYMAKAAIYRNIDNHMEEKFMMAACDLCLEVYGEDHIFSARLCKNVAIMYEEDHKDLKSAFMYYEKWYKTLNQVLGSEHPDTVMARKLINDSRFASLRRSLTGSIPEGEDEDINNNEDLNKNGVQENGKGDSQSVKDLKQNEEPTKDQDELASEENDRNSEEIKQKAPGDSDSVFAS